jgi:hypothetical protein
MSKKRIAYKVISAEFRCGTNMTIWLKQWTMRDKTPAQVLSHAPKLRPYFPTYTKGSIVTAAPNSAGILCFDTLDSAHAFMDEEFEDRVSEYNLKIIKVRLIGRQNKRPMLLRYIGSDILGLIKPGEFRKPYYVGVIAVPAVEVLE